MPGRISFRAMGCDILAIVEDVNGEAVDMLNRVPEWFEEWEQALSRFRIDSELVLLNRQPGHPVQVSETLWEVFRTARWAEQFTGGMVTPTTAAALVSAGYDRTFDDLTADLNNGGEPSAPAVPPFSAVRADAKARTLCIPEGIQLDFGGVAKGWAAHQAMLRLEAFGPALVDAGGDIAISDSLPGPEPWEVAVADPLHPGREVTRLFVEDCGVATSGKDHRRWKRDGRLFHHIIDPRSGLPAETDLVTVTVVAPTVMMAEAAAKTVMILGSTEGFRWLTGQPGLAGLFVLEDGQALATEAMETYL